LLFTDGGKYAKCVGTTGWAIVHNGDWTSDGRVYFPIISSYTAELEALDDGLRKLLDLTAGREWSYPTLHVFTDSASVVSGFPNWIARRISQTESNILDSILTLQEQRVSVSLHWIPGHEGYAGNELADEASRKVLENGRVPRRLALGLDAFKHLAKQELRGGYRDTRAEWVAPLTKPARASLLNAAGLSGRRSLRLLCNHWFGGRDYMRYKDPEVSALDDTLAHCKFCSSPVEFHVLLPHLLIECPAVEVEEARSICLDGFSPASWIGADDAPSERQTLCVFMRSLSLNFEAWPSVGSFFGELNVRL